MPKQNLSIGKSLINYEEGKREKKYYSLLQSETNVYKNLIFAMDEVWQPYVV